MVSKKREITVFKIRIDSIENHAIGFELFSGNQVNDVYINVLAKGGYGVKNRIILTPKQFTDFANRLIAYVYITKKKFDDRELTILWALKLNIFDNENQQKSESIFQKERKRLVKFGFIKGGDDRKKGSKT